jgi:hypothetical protein
MSARRVSHAAALLAAASLVAMVAEPAVASAQGGPGYDDQGPPQDQYAQAAPPYQGQYAPPPYSRAGDDYQAQYAAWEMQNCVIARSNNTAAGAILGGAAGALLGFSLAGWAARGAWALFGGVMGSAVGAAVGSSAGSASCPHGYALRSGAPPFYYGPAYGYGAPAYAPAPYAYAPPRPYYAGAPSYAGAPRGRWVWDGRWVWRPWAAPGYGARPYP